MPILLLLLSLTAAGANYETNSPAIIVQPVLDMFSKPSAEADVVSQARYAMTVSIVSSEGEWRRIRTPDDYLGWAHQSGLRLLNPGEIYPANGVKSGMVGSLFAHLYPVASVTRRKATLTVPFETQLEVIEEGPEEGARWLGVRLPDGRKAWVQRGDLAFNPQSLPVTDLISLARRFMGLPYTWGGTTAFGYDCSGFTQMLCRRGGVSIPRDAKPQALWEGMIAIGKADLTAGDLLYFGPSIERINHTGFYIGGGEFIHATTSGSPVVQVSRLDEEKWTKALVACRRWKK